MYPLKSPVGTVASEAGLRPETLVKSRRVAGRRQFLVLQSVLDLLALTAAWRAAIELRLLLNPVMNLHFTRAEVARLAPPPGLILLLWIAVIPWLGARRRRRDSSVGAGLLRVAGSSLMSSMLMIVAAFFSQHFGADLSRSLVLIFAPVSFVLLMASRYAALLAIPAVAGAWSSRERVAVVGDGAEARLMLEALRCSPERPAIAGVILPDGGAAAFGAIAPVLGVTRQMAEIINRARLDRIIISSGRLPREEVERCARVSGRMGVIVSEAIPQARKNARLGVAEMYGMQLLEMRPLPLSRRDEIVKRILDAAAASALLALLTPVMILLALAVKLTSKGPALYRSARVGRGGRYFTFLKFRSMYFGHDRGALAEHNEQNGHLFKVRRDPRVTPLGRILRRYSLDELPQLINVLRGDMSLVGPRPLPAEDLEADGQSRLFAAWSEQRSLVPPGITGLWQVSGRSDMPFDRMTELDMEYIRNRSLALDLRILLETPFVVLTGRGAY